MKTENERLINLCAAIDEFDCPREVKQQALKLFGITSKTVYVHPLQQQMDRINLLFESNDPPRL